MSIKEHVFNWFFKPGLLSSYPRFIEIPIAIFCFCFVAFYAMPEISANAYEDSYGAIHDAFYERCIKELELGDEGDFEGCFDAYMAWVDSTNDFLDKKQVVFK